MGLVEEENSYLRSKIDNLEERKRVRDSIPQKEELGMEIITFYEDKVKVKNRILEQRTRKINN